MITISKNKYHYILCIKSFIYINNWDKNYFNNKDTNLFLFYISNDIYNIQKTDGISIGLIMAKMKMYHPFLIQ